MKHWVVFGRIDGDDEDTGAVYDVDTEEQARAAFIDDMRCLMDTPDNEFIYINAVAWSNAPIHIV